MKEILKYLRQLNSLSQEEIAGHLNISRQSYIKYENGTVIPSDKIVSRLAQIYGVTEEFLRANRVPKPNSISSYAETKHAEYKISSEDSQSALQVAEPSIEYGTSPRKIFEGVFDGRDTVKILDSLDKYDFREGQRFKLYIENEEEEEKRREDAWETIMSFRGTLPADFDYKKELLEALNEKYGITD